MALSVCHFARPALAQAYHPINVTMADRRLRVLANQL
jgi:hypothetical protein